MKDVTAAAAEPEKNAQQDNAGNFSQVLNFSYFFFQVNIFRRHSNFNIMFTRSMFMF